MKIRHLGHQVLVIKEFVQGVFPLVDEELQKWAALLEHCPCEALRYQALASIRTKRFHAQGGSIYALFPGVEVKPFVRFVVALQTISDYLDNLCDRAGVYEEKAFRQLHLAMQDAVIPAREPCHDYYKFFPYQDDGGYLSALVRECREVITGYLPGYGQVQEDLLRLVNYYIDLQSTKHLSLDVREEMMLNWAARHKPPELTPWEFGAATGSTLGMFMLAAAAFKEDLTAQEVLQIKEAYFPWVTGLHILLDYYIDQEEDREEGDLNFLHYYGDGTTCQQRLILFVEQALAKTAALPEHLFHELVIKGLLAMYLSDPKAVQGDKKGITRRILAAGGYKALIMHRICQKLRASKKL